MERRSVLVMADNDVGCAVAVLLTRAGHITYPRLFQPQNASCLLSSPATLSSSGAASDRVRSNNF
jgi:hypothetical protein